MRFGFRYKHFSALSHSALSDQEEARITVVTHQTSISSPAHLMVPEAHVLDVLDITGPIFSDVDVCVVTKSCETITISWQ